MKLASFFTAVALLFSSHTLSGDLLKIKKGHEITFGQEGYNLKRTLASSGTSTHGWFHGWRGSYDHIARNSIYWGVESGMAQGPICGKHSSGVELKADMWDIDAEMRLGYTLGKKKWRNLLFTPFAGYKYMRSHIHFVSPKPSTPLLFPKHEDSFHAVLAGFFLRFDACECVSLGADIRTIYMYDGRDILENASAMYPFLERTMGDRVHWVVQTPIDIKAFSEPNNLRLRLMPFYRCRQYGFWEGSPANHPKTTIRNYGLAVQLWYEI